MLDWIFEGIITWVSSVVTDLMDAVSGMFLQALGTDMTAMEEYFPFVSKAFTVMQYTAWALLFLITVWQLFRVFGGPVTDAENPWALLARSALMALLIGYSKPIFSMVLNIARAPYTALMDIQLSAEDFTFDTDVFEITTDPNELGAVRDALEAKGYTFESAEVAYIPQTMTTLTDEEDIKWMERLIDMLEENDDVQEIWHNWEMPDEE